MDWSVSLKHEIWFHRVCHHISNAVYFCTDFYTYSQGEALGTAWLLCFFLVTAWLLPGYFLVISQLLPGSYWLLPG